MRDRRPGKRLGGDTVGEAGLDQGRAMKGEKRTSKRDIQEAMQVDGSGWGEEGLGREASRMRPKVPSGNLVYGGATLEEEQV